MIAKVEKIITGTFINRPYWRFFSGYAPKTSCL